MPLAGNTLASGNPWRFVTWGLQVMPLFFIAGAAVNKGSWTRHTGTYSAWIWQRVSRLMRPTVIYLTEAVLKDRTIQLEPSGTGFDSQPASDGSNDVYLSIPPTGEAVERLLTIR